MARSLNKVMLMGNLTRDPELRYTPSGSAVCSFGLATNRSWNTDGGEKHEETEFHKIVAWNKLAELCSQFLTKGRKVYVEGRLSTRNWTTQDGQQRTTTEIIISDMILIDSQRTGVSYAPAANAETSSEEPSENQTPSQASGSGRQEASKPSPKKEEKVEETLSDISEEMNENISPDDIPF